MVILLVGIIIGVLACFLATDVINLSKFNNYVKISFKNKSSQAVKSTEISYNDSRISGPNLAVGENGVLIFSEFSRLGIDFSTTVTLDDGRTLNFAKLPTHNGEEWEIDIYPNQLSPGKTRTTW